MVVKIQNSYQSMRHTLDYNEDKVSSKEAERIAVFNINQNNDREIRDVFDKYERWNIRTTEVSFQMSINPNHDAGEKMTDVKAIELAYEIMNKLGYANQPIAIYRHNDIDREHYHVVSIRTNEKGRKIKDTWEIKKLQKILRSLEKKYGFVIGNNEKQNTQQTKVVQTPEKTNTIAPSDNLSRQYLEAFDKAMQYHFRTFTQFKAIMRWYNIDVNKNEYQRQDVICLQAIDQQNQGCATPLKEYELGRRLLEEMNARTMSCREDKKRYIAERKRIAELFKTKANESRSLEELERKLKEDGIGMYVSRNKDGHIFGLTLIDHNEKMAFKGNEIDKSLTYELINKYENVQTPELTETNEVDRYINPESNDDAQTINSTSDSYFTHEAEEHEYVEEIISSFADILSQRTLNTDSGSDGKPNKRKTTRVKKKIKKY